MGVQHTLDVQEGLLAQVRMQLTAAHERVVELRLKYARDRPRLLAYASSWPTTARRRRTWSTWSSHPMDFGDLLQKVTRRSGRRIPRTPTPARSDWWAERGSQSRPRVGDWPRSRPGERGRRSPCSPSATRSPSFGSQSSTANWRRQEIAQASSASWARSKKTLSMQEGEAPAQATIATLVEFRSERIPVKTTSGPYIDPLQFVRPSRSASGSGRGRHPCPWERR